MQTISRRLEAITDQRSLVLYHSVVCLAILIFSCAYSLSVGKDGNWDLLNYHFYNPAALLTERLGFDVFPAQRQNWLNPLMDIPTYLMIANFKPVLVGAVMGLWHGLNLIFGYFITLRVFFFMAPFTSAILATVVTVMATTGSLVRGLWGSFTGDLTVSIFVLAALCLFLSALTAPPGKLRTRNLIWSGVLMGIGTGIRMTVAVHAIPLLALSLLLGSTLSTRLRAFIVYGLACGVGYAIAYGYWAALLFSRYGSPFFPYYNAIFRSPLIANINLVDLRWMPTSLLDHLTLPFTYLIGPGQGDVNFRDWRPGIVYGALIVLGLVLLWRFLRRNYAGLLAWDKAKPTAVLLIFTVVSWAIWQVQFSYYRYLAPLEILFPVIMLSISYLLIPSRRLLLLVAVVLLVVLVRKTTPMFYPRGSWGDSYFEVNIPSDLQLDNAQVIIVDSDRPLAYLVPYFPASTQVLRLTSNLELALHDSVYTGLNDLRKREVLKPLPKFVMYDEHVKAIEQAEINRVLAEYGLQKQMDACATVTSSFGAVNVCRLTMVATADRSLSNR